MRKQGEYLILFFGIVIYIILLAMCISQIRQSNRLTTRNLQAEVVPQRIEIALQLIDTIADSVEIVGMDSLIEVLKEWNDEYDETMLHGLDDLRQETNNVINKQNGWFSFWLGILALVGALLPFVIQLKLQHDQKQRVDTELNKIIQLRDEQEKAMLYSDITKLSFALISCKENKWSKDDYDRDHFWDDMLHEKRKKTSRFIDTITASDVFRSDNVFYLKVVLLQLHSVYCVYIPTCTKSYKARQLLLLTKEIGNILGKLASSSYTSVNEIQDALELMLIHMASFSV